jgi:hypothetical protein
MGDRNLHAGLAHMGPKIIYLLFTTVYVQSVYNKKIKGTFWAKLQPQALGTARELLNIPETFCGQLLSSPADGDPT